MADYSTLAEACSLLPGGPTLRDTGTGTTATKPNATQGAYILTSVTSEIDMHLRGQGYATPATDATALAALKTICMNGAAARIGKAMPTSRDDDLVANLREDYKAGLAFIDAGGLSADAETEDESTISYDFTRPYDVLGSANNGETDSPF